MADIYSAPPVPQTDEVNEQPTTNNTLDQILENTELIRTANDRKTADMIKLFRNITIAMAIICAALSVCLVVTCIGWLKEEGKVKTQVETVEVIKEVEVPAYKVIDPYNDYSHRLSEDSFLLNDSSYGPIWMPALADVPKSSHSPELFVKDEATGVISYADESVTTFRGIDVSTYQGNIDWEEVKAAGVDFAIIRCGFRGYVTGSVNEDANFKKNLKEAKAAGVDVGIYFFSQATDTEEALEEAEFCLEAVKGYELEYPIYYDWEVVHDKDGDTPRTAYIQPEDLTANALVFAERIRQEGYTPGIYTNKKTAVWKYDLSRLGGIDIWLAEYSDTPTYFYDYGMWQYSSKGSVPGIVGNVDMNICFTDFSARENVTLD